MRNKWFVLLLFPLAVFAESELSGNCEPWNLEELFQAPLTCPVPELAAEAEPCITPLFFESEDFHGGETRVFAWVGIPPGEGPFPAMVLVHGGGGTAYQEWVKLWMDRGYAAIAVDTAGQIPTHPEGEKRKWMSHEYSGPRGWGGFNQIDDPVKDQWTYHAVAAVIRAHSLLRSYPQVDAARIGVTGISWGGYLTCIVAGLDDRFRLAVPVYGCGFLEDGSYWVSTFLDPSKTDGTGEKWISLWDPRHYIPRAEMPMLFVNGTNDKYYWMKAWQKTVQAVQGPVTLCCKVRLVHNHAAGWGNEEIYAFADSILKAGAALPQITHQVVTGQTVTVMFDCETPVDRAELNYTIDAGERDDQVWHSQPMEINDSAGKATGLLPESTAVYFVNLIDDRGLISSSSHERTLFPKEK
jgi:dienelactone hydrolase